ncbi:MAG TPA: helix-turn-helix transcriptional regulator [Alphaproteobacteria bacterium]|nr:helix-turn-helix transcriptional regulator [Alphaproteobacteria bacterium]
MTLQQAIGRRLRELRQEKGLTQKELALKTRGKLDYSYIGKIERGEQMPSIKVLKRLGDALAVPIDRFFQRIDGESATQPGRYRGRGEALDAQRRHLLFYLARTVHDDDIPLLFEIVRVLNKHRKEGAPQKRSPTDSPHAAEEAESYPRR